MNTYDYRKETGYINEMHTKIDTISEKQAKVVSEFIDTLKENCSQEQALLSLEWCNCGILPVLQNFAQMTCSLLTLERPDKSTIVASLTNDNGFDITESCRFMRTLFNFANHIGINSNDNETCLTFIFDCCNFIG